MMKFPWFRKVGILFIPVTAFGWLVFTAVIAAAVYISLDIDGITPSFHDKLFPVFLNLSNIFIIYMLVAFLTSRTAR